MPDNRYGRDNDWRGGIDGARGRGGGFGRDHDRSDAYRGYGEAPGYGRGDDDRNLGRDRGLGAYSQGVGGHIDHRRQSGYGDDRHRDPGGYARGNGFGPTEPRHAGAEPDDHRGRDLTQAPPTAAYRTEGRDNERFDNRDEDRRIAVDETDEVIASNKVEGTRVYNRRGERLGTIENFMVGKRSGRVEYVVMSFGGFLGLGERHYPLPWSVLKYDAHLGGYKIDIDGDERALRHAPSYRPSEEPRWDRAFRQHVFGFYGLS